MANPDFEQQQAINELNENLVKQYGFDTTSKTNGSKDLKNEEKIKKKIPAYKYSARLHGDLNESVILGETAVFLKYVNPRIVIVPSIEENTRIIRPPDEEEYPYEPYRFDKIIEIENYVKRALNESHDSLYNKIESIVSAYNDQNDYKLNMISADAFWSYFQDRFGTTHYDCITGGNGSGKSSLGDTFGAIAYRAVNMTDPTAANLYRLLGPIEPGQCTMILEESEKIDQSQDLMSTLKTGYTLNGRVPRINMNTGNQEFFFSFGLKVIIAERSPNQNLAKGVLDRTFGFSCYKGTSRYDIKEVLNPTETGGPEHLRLLEELNDLRKLLLIYRLVHFKDSIPDIDIGIIGRDKELAKPLIQLFNGTNAQKKIITTLQKLLDLKNKRKQTRLDAILIPIVISLISEYGTKFYHAIFWEYLRQCIPGKQDEKKPGEYHTEEYGTIYRSTITSVLRDSFGAETKHEKGGNVLIFDEKILSVLQKKYTDTISVKLIKGEGSEGSEGSGEKGSVTSPVELDKELKINDTPFSQVPSSPSPLHRPLFMQTCRHCGEEIAPFYMKIHRCEGTD